MSAYETNTYVYGFQMINRMADLGHSDARFPLLPTNGVPDEKITLKRAIKIQLSCIGLCVCVCVSSANDDV